MQMNAISMRPLDNGKTKKKRKKSKNKKSKAKETPPASVEKTPAEIAQNGPKTKSVISEAINAHKYKNHS